VHTQTNVLEVELNARHGKQSTHTPRQSGQLAAQVKYSSDVVRMVNKITCF